MASWKCKDCKYTTEWEDKDVSEKGTPVCPDCDTDMELDVQETTIGKMSDKELLAEAKSLFDAIYTVECFNTRDMVLYDTFCEELEKRGYEITENKTLSIKKGGE